MVCFDKYFRAERESRYLCGSLFGTALACELQRGGGGGAFDWLVD